LYIMAINRIDNTLQQNIIEQIILPELPEKITFSTLADNSEYKIIELGNVIIPGDPKLQEISFSATFSSLEYVEKIKKIMEDKEIFRFILTREDLSGADLGEINTLAVIKEFKFEEKGGEIGVIHYDLKLTQYRPFGIKVISS
jgi:hypothetical protein